MTSEIVKKAYYGIRSSQKGLSGLGRWSKRLIMPSKMVRKEGKTENYDVRDSKKCTIWHPIW